MKKSLFSIVFCILFINYCFGQHPELPDKELLKEYSSYAHKFESKSCWKYKYKLKNGLVVQQENYCNNKLTQRTKFEYDGFDNVVRKIYDYDVNEGIISDTINFQLIYEESRLIEKKFSPGWYEHYSNFTELGKPKLIERIDEYLILPYKEVLEYDERGNIIRSIKFTRDFNDNSVVEKATTHFKYDKWNNVVEIHREFEPEQEFPIIMIGGPLQYEFEYFRYVYNEKGLWTEKYKTVEGKEYLVATRKFK
jgi:uncharacterized protein YrzB (UPF0473 family)